MRKKHFNFVGKFEFRSYLSYYNCTKASQEVSRSLGRTKATTMWPIIYKKNDKVQFWLKSAILYLCLMLSLCNLCTQMETIINVGCIFFYIDVGIFLIEQILIRFVKSTAFCTVLQLLLFQIYWNNWVTLMHQTATQTCQLIGIAAILCKKQWVWQLLQKIQGKWA